MPGCLTREVLPHQLDSVNALLVVLVQPTMEGTLRVHTCMNQTPSHQPLSDANEMCVDTMHATLK